MPQIEDMQNWKQFLKNIEQELPSLTFNSWFAPLKPRYFGKGTIKASVPNPFFIEWIEERYSHLIKRCLSNSFGEGYNLVLFVDEDYENSNQSSTDDFNLAIEFESDSKALNSFLPNNNTSKNLVEKKDNIQNNDFILNGSFVKESQANLSLNSKEGFDPKLKAKYTFENFVVGEGNQLARAAAYAVAERPGETTFNPLFIYGGVGLGKTHLLHAIGNKALELYPNKKIIYRSADEFTVDFIESVKSNNTEAFSNFYKQVDILIIDDIQYLINKEKTQDLFFHIFNSLHQQGKQIVLSSDKPPKDLKGMNERLISRFLWGLSADIQPPDLETRIAILKKKSEDYGIKISPEIMEYIALNITSNIREMEGCLIKLLANASLTNRDITIELAKKTVKEISTNKKISLTINDIVRHVCSYFKIDENKLREKNRKKEIALARQISMYLCKKLTSSSLKTIGLYFGGRDHSTVIHAIAAIEKKVSEDAKFSDLIESIKNKIELEGS
jgi:chromosomal replication initiator protein